MSLKKEKNNFTLLRLFVAGESESSRKAISNLDAIAKDFLPGRHKIEVVNTLDNHSGLFEEGVLVTPTLIIKNDLLPPRRIIGDLSDKQKVLRSLGDLTNGSRHRSAESALPIPKVKPAGKSRRSK